MLIGLSTFCRPFFILIQRENVNWNDYLQNLAYQSFLFAPFFLIGLTMELLSYKRNLNGNFKITLLKYLVVVKIAHLLRIYFFIDALSAWSVTENSLKLIMFVGAILHVWSFSDDFETISKSKETTERPEATVSFINLNDHENIS